MIPLSLGGNNSNKNLWPEPEKGTKNATSKDGVERGIRTLVCNGTVPLNVAQRAIANDWTTALVTVTPTTTTTNDYDHDGSASAASASAASATASNCRAATRR